VGKKPKSIKKVSRGGNFRRGGVKAKKAELREPLKEEGERKERGETGLNHQKSREAEEGRGARRLAVVSRKNWRGAIW